MLCFIDLEFSWLNIRIHNNINKSQNLTCKQYFRAVPCAYWSLSVATSQGISHISVCKHMKWIIKNWFKTIVINTTTYFCFLFSISSDFALNFLFSILFTDHASRSIWLWNEFRFVDICLLFLRAQLSIQNYYRKSEISVCNKVHISFLLFLQSLCILWLCANKSQMSTKRNYIRI